MSNAASLAHSSRSLVAFQRQHVDAKIKLAVALSGADFFDTKHDVSGHVFGQHGIGSLTNCHIQVARTKAQLTLRQSSVVRCADAAARMVLGSCRGSDPRCGAGIWTGIAVLPVAAATIAGGLAGTAWGIAEGLLTYPMAAPGTTFFWHMGVIVGTRSLHFSLTAGAMVGSISYGLMQIGGFMAAVPLALTQGLAYAWGLTAIRHAWDKSVQQVEPQDDGLFVTDDKKGSYDARLLAHNYIERCAAFEDNKAMAPLGRRPLDNAYEGRVDLTPEEMARLLFHPSLSRQLRPRLLHAVLTLPTSDQIQAQNRDLDFFSATVSAALDSNAGRWLASTLSSTGGGTSSAQDAEHIPDIFPEQASPDRDGVLQLGVRGGSHHRSRPKSATPLADRALDGATADLHYGTTALAGEAWVNSLQPGGAIYYQAQEDTNDGLRIFQAGRLFLPDGYTSAEVCSASRIVKGPNPESVGVGVHTAITTQAIDPFTAETHHAKLYVKMAFQTSTAPANRALLETVKEAQRLTGAPRNTAPRRLQ